MARNNARTRHRAENEGIFGRAQSRCRFALRLQHRWRSDGERLMTLRTSAVAVCCSSASIGHGACLQLLEQPNVLDGDGRLIGKGLDQRDLACR